MKNPYFSRPLAHKILKTWQCNIVIPVNEYMISYSGDDGNCSVDGDVSMRHYLRIWHVDDVDKDLTEEFGFETYGDIDLLAVIDTVRSK